MKNNAETVSKFLVPILTDNKLLENPNIQLIISVWEIPFKRILTEVRTQKHFCPLLLWTTVSLEKALNQRLLVFSDGKIKITSSYLIMRFNRKVLLKFSNYLMEIQEICGMF